METMRRLHVAVAAICAVTVSISLAAEYAAAAPQPQGQPPLRPPATTPGQTPPAPRPAAPPTAAPAAAPKAPPTAAVPAAEPAPTAQSLGLPVYPAAQYLGTYDAGRSQKYVLFGTTSAFLEVVGYYRTQLSDKGDQVFKEPLTHVFVQQIKLTDSYTVGVDLHRNVYEKIAKGDPIGARQAVRRLMQSTRNHVKTALQMLSSDGR